MELSEEGTLYSAILKTTLKEFEKDVIKTALEYNDIQNVQNIKNTSSMLCYNIDKNKTATGLALTLHNTIDTYNFVKYNKLLKNISNKIIIKQTPQSLLEIINESVKLVNKFQDNIYGILIRHKSKKHVLILNPLHPLTALTLVDKKANIDLNKKEWIMSIYTYKNRQQMNKEYYSTTINSSCKKEYDDILKKCISTYVLRYNIKAPDLVAISPFDILKNNNDIHKSYSFIYENTNTNTEHNKDIVTIIPIQLVNTGLISPFYGVAAVNKCGKSGNYTGYNLTPVRTGNISPDSRNVCTGNETTKLSTLYVLSHNNLTSAHTQDIIAQKNSLIFIDMSINYAMTIYKRAKIVDEIIPIPIKIKKEKSDEANAIEILANILDNNAASINANLPSEEDTENIPF